MSSYLDREGYRILTGQQGHPLARKNGEVPEHRKVLYEKIGPGPHLCYWGCGKELVWKGDSVLLIICSDHLDNDVLNNDPRNLVPSCRKCNWDRAHTPEGSVRVFGPPYKNNKTSGVRGVSWEKRRNRWKCVVLGKWVGYFDDLGEAERAAVSCRNTLSDAPVIPEATNG